MDIGAIVSRARKTAADNTPTILTTIGVTGTIATAILASKASFKAAEILKEAAGKRAFSEGEINPLQPKEKAELTWKFFVPTVTTGVVTIVCIVTANQVSNRRAAALATAYSISQETFREYKGKVFEKIGEKKEQNVRDAIAKDRVDAVPEATFVLLGDDGVPFLDMHSGRTFISDVETIRAAVNKINYKLLSEDYATLSDFWELVGLESTSESGEIGWNVDRQLEVDFGSTVKGNKPVMTIEFRTIPTRRYYPRY